MSRRRLASALAISLLLPAASVLTAACGGEAGQRSAATPAPSAADANANAAPAPAEVADAKAVAPETSPLPAASPDAPPTKVPGAKRIVALGDVHGDLGATRQALRVAGAIDADDRWIGGDLVVVQTGDQLDRGDDEREILDLLARLEGEAKAAGGALYVLNGNHELMNAAGDLRYVTAGGHLDFADVPGVDPNDPRAQRVPPQARGRLLAFAPGGPYATRLAKRNVVQIVGDTVFVHGGVLPEHVRYGLDRINRETQAWLRGEGELPEKVVADDQSPVWTRRYSSAPGPEDCAVLEEALAAIPAKRMVVGHTVHTEGITSACDGKVWMIDVGMAAYYGGHAEALEITGDEVKALRPE